MQGITEYVICKNNWQSPLFLLPILFLQRLNKVSSNKKDHAAVVLESHLSCFSLVF